MVKRVWVHGDDLWPNNRTARHAEYIAASDYDALAAEVLAIKEHCAALESREVCSVAHEDVETCGYCQRDALYRLLQGIVSDVENYADMSVRLKPGATAARMYFLEMP